jgi:hypothetical protein
LRTPVLSDFWQGYRYITTPDVDLFAEAAVAKDHQGYWEDDDAADEEDDSDEDENDEEDEWDVDSFASRHLELHLPQELIDEVRAHVSAVNPEYAALLNRPEDSKTICEQNCGVAATSCRGLRGRGRLTPPESLYYGSHHAQPIPGDHPGRRPRPIGPLR